MSYQRYPFTAELQFNMTMKKASVDEKSVPDDVCIFGYKTSAATRSSPLQLRKQRRRNPPNSAAEVQAYRERHGLGQADQYAAAKLKSSVTCRFANSNLATAWDVDEDQRDRLYAMAREAQLREHVVESRKVGELSSS